MRGKDKCKALKEIRRKIAEENDIAFAVEECSHKGDCKGTCPRCESELRYLERELEKKRMLGEKVAIAGISMGAMTALAGCNPVDDLIVKPVSYAVDAVENAFGTGNNDIDYDIDYAGGMVDYVEPEMGEPTYQYDPEDDSEYVDPHASSDDGEEIIELAGDVAAPEEEFEEESSNCDDDTCDNENDVIEE